MTQTQGVGRWTATCWLQLMLPRWQNDAISDARPKSKTSRFCPFWNWGAGSIVGSIQWNVPRDPAISILTVSSEATEVMTFHYEEAT